MQRGTLLRMSFKTWYRNQASAVAFEGYLARGGQLRYGMRTWPLAGATADIENAAGARSRATVTRVAAGGMLLGPLGALLGGMSKKDLSRLFVIIELADGQIITIEVKGKKESDARKFVAAIRQQAATSAD